MGLVMACFKTWDFTVRRDGLRSSRVYEIIQIDSAPVSWQFSP